MYLVRFSKAYEKSIKKLVKSGAVKQYEVNIVINLLLNKKELLPKYRDHKLRGEYEGYRECHVRPDILLVYKIEKKELVLVLIDIGSHSYLF
jgi:mRNA interferase YafQ